MKHTAPHRTTSNLAVRLAFTAGFAVLPLAAVVLHSGAAAAQRTASRTVTGTVNSGSGPLKGAVVHLKDTRSLTQKSYITAEDGSYRFAQLSGTTDYELWAESEGKKSATKTISSFDSKDSFSIALKIQ